MDSVRKNLLFEKLDGYITKHPEVVNKLGSYFEKSPGASYRDLKENGFKEILNCASGTNVLKEYFGIGEESFNCKRLSEKEYIKWKEKFKEFIIGNNGRFKLNDLNKNDSKFINKYHDGKIYRAIFDVCRNDDREFNAENFIPFANYAVGIFLFRDAIFSKLGNSQDRESLESGAYLGLLKSKVNLEKDNPLYLLNSCIWGIGSEDNFIGNVKKSITIGFATRRLLKYCKKRELDYGEILQKFNSGKFSSGVIAYVRRFLDRPKIVSLDAMLDREESFEESFREYSEREGECGFGSEVFENEEIFGIIENGNNRLEEIDNLNYVFSLIKNKKRREIIIRRILGEETLENIAKDYFVVRERIRQLEFEALERLSYNFGRKIIEGFII